MSAQETPPSGEIRAVFMGFAEISGFYSGLAQGFSELGIRVTTVDLGAHRFGYPRAPRSRLVRAVEAVSARRGAGGLRAAALLPAAAALRVLLLLWAVPRHDTFIFGFGTSFMNLRELPLLKALGKTVIFQFHGSDARPPYIDGAVVRGTGADEIDAVLERTRGMKKRMRRIDRHADHVVNNPTHGHFHERPIVTWLRLGLPTRPRLPERIPESAGDGVRVLHCPSDLRAKGTHLVRDAVARLEERGLPIEYVEITGRPHSVVLDELARCDLVVDQLYADYGMPGFATEAAWHGKPVLIGGYAVEFWRELLPPDEWPPTAYCTPQDFEAELERLVADRAARTELGASARRFVDENWSPRDVASRYVRLTSGTYPPEWLYDLAELRYLHGAGLSETELRTILQKVLQRGGPGALELADKPALEAAFITFAR